MGDSPRRPGEGLREGSLAHKAWEVYTDIPPVTDEELDDPTIVTIVKLIWNTLGRLLREPLGILLGSAFIVLIVWGHHGKLELLGVVVDGWEGPGSDPATRARLIPGIPWDQEWISFGAGAVLLLGLPALLITRVFKQPLSAYGLGLPRESRRGLTALSAVVLLGLSLPVFYLGAQNPSMQATYPLYRGTFTSGGQFWLYELGQLPFFVAIEFIFRGFLLFGLFQITDANGPQRSAGEARRPLFGYYAIFISMLSYTAWHLGKPAPELWGTLVWGVAAGSIALATGTVWHIIGVHWVLNVFLDYVIWTG